MLNNYRLICLYIYYIINSSFLYQKANIESDNLSTLIEQINKVDTVSNVVNTHF